MSIFKESKLKQFRYGDDCYNVVPCVVDWYGVPKRAWYMPAIDDETTATVFVDYNQLDRFFGYMRLTDGTLVAPFTADELNFTFDKGEYKDEE